MSVLQKWVEKLPNMQQSVLLAGIRGADGTPKFHKSKFLVRFLRRSILISAFDGKPLNNPWHEGGGSFTGPSITASNLKGFGVWEQTSEDVKWRLMEEIVDDFIDSRDEMTLHYYSHFMHAVEILGYKHDSEPIRIFWHGVYLRMVHALHLWPETENQMDSRLGDTISGWKAREDSSSNCSD